MKLIIPGILFFFIISCSENRESEIITLPLTFAESLQQNKISPESQFKIFIDKSEFTLEILYQEKTLVQYPMVLGGNPEDDKRMEGDKCTPEGLFKVRSKFEHRKWDKFIWVDYPNDDSKIKFSQAKEDGTIPEDATIGGEIGIHGVPEGRDDLIDKGQNWTLGCISLKNKHINEFYQYIDTDKWMIEIVP